MMTVTNNNYGTAPTEATQNTAAQVAATAEKANASQAPALKIYKTDDFISVISAADKAAGDKGPDGYLTRDELKAYQDSLKQQSSLVNSLSETVGKFFGNEFGDVFKKFGESLKTKQDSADVLLKNYDCFSTSDGKIDKGISKASIQKVAETDGKADDISDKDLAKPEVKPPATKPSIQDLLIQLLKALLQQFSKNKAGGEAGVTPEPATATATAEAKTEAASEEA